MECGHLFDLDCISDWCRKQNSCPLDRTSIDPTQIQYAEGVIKKVSAIFSFKFLQSGKIDPISVNVYSSVQRLKSLISLALNSGEENLVVAAFSPEAEKQPRALSLVGAGKKLYSDTMLAPSISPGMSCNIYAFTKFAQYGLPCDRCHRHPELEQTCNHPDENESIEDETITS